MFTLVCILPAMLISMAAFDAMDTSLWATHCRITIREQQEHDLKSLIDAITAESLYFYIAIGEVLLSGLTEHQISLLIERCPDLVYRDDFDSVYLLEDLWHVAKDVVAKIAPNATRQRLIAGNLSLADPQMIDKLRTELSIHSSLNYVQIEFAED